MTFSQYLQSIKSKAPTILLVILAVLIATMSLTLVLGQPFKYRSTVQLLVVQKQGPAVDAYTAIRSAEKMADNLSAVVYTSSFLDRALEAPYQTIDTLPTDPVKRKREWKKMVETNVLPETGIIEISVYNPNRNQAVAYAQAISWVLVNQGDQYHGGGSDVEIRSIDAPLTSNHPVKPNLLINLLVALMIGSLISLVVVYLAGEETSEYRMQNSEFSPVRQVSVASEISEEQIAVKNNNQIDNSDEPMLVSPQPDMSLEEYKKFIQNMYQK